MLTSACMLADIFPAEWPPAGAARQGAGCHLPPAHMRYRAALARSFEPSATSLRRLLATAVGSEAVLFRGALVRLCARASGLGGGMGAFMVGPLMEELAEAAQPSKPLFDARRCLEVLVPLAYRPAIKVRTLCLSSATVVHLGSSVGEQASMLSRFSCPTTPNKCQASNICWGQECSAFCTYQSLDCCCL